MPTLPIKFYVALGALLAEILLGLALYLWGDHHGHAVVQAQWNDQKAIMSKALADAQEKAATISERVVTKYVDRVQTVTQQGATITKTIPVYIHAKDDAACPIPAGFGQLLDAAATGSVDALGTDPTHAAITPAPAASVR